MNVTLVPAQSVPIGLAAMLTETVLLAVVTTETALVVAVSTVGEQVEVATT